MSYFSLDTKPASTEARTSTRSHLLLGLWREDSNIRTLLKGKGDDSEIRREIERHIVWGDHFATSVDVPLSAESKKALHFAAEEADRLGQRPIGTEHLLLGLLRVEDSLGARAARARGVNAEELRMRLAKPQTSAVVVPTHYRKPALLLLELFLTGLKSQSADYLMSYFAGNAQVVDVHGKEWKHDELGKNFQEVFAPYAKKNAAYVVEETPVDSNEQLVATVLWKNALVASMERVWMHRMTVVLKPESDEWEIAAIQVTPVQT